VLEDSTFNSQDDTQLVKFDYIKSNLFRVLTADGATATLTPQGKIFLYLYNERVPIPRQLTYELLPDRTLGKEVSNISREGFVREVEVGILIDTNVAEGIIDVLSKIVNSRKGISEPASESSLE
jgi:hypothetical protein